MRPPSTTRPAITTTVSVAANNGSHQVAAPMAMRVGMAIGAVAGNHDTTRAQVASGLPVAAKHTK